MNESFHDYVEGARTLAIRHGVQWDLPVGLDGLVDHEFAWDVTHLCGATPPPTVRMNNLGYDIATLAIVNKRAAAQGIRAASPGVLSTHWQDLLKASVIYQVFVSRNTPSHAVDQIGRPVRVIATCVQVTSGAEPWAMSIADIREAIDVAGEVQQCGGLAALVHGVVKNTFDARYLCDQGPFGDRVKPEKTIVRRWAANPPTMLSRLEDRKDASKLPEDRALWELVEIVFTKQPRSFLDFLRFGQLKVLILTGFRAGEVASIPSDWKREKERVVLDSSTGAGGTVSRSISVRHFAEKQSGHKRQSVTLHEAVQDVPAVFEEIMTSTLDAVDRMTAPLRERLKRQIETGRMFPEFQRTDLVSVFEMYVRLSGNPTYRGGEPPAEWVNEYRQTGNPALFDRIAAIQQESEEPIRPAVYTYWNRWSNRKGAPPFRLKDGTAVELKGQTYGSLFLLIGEVEDFIKHAMPTKMSDTQSLALANGEFAASEFMFLMPKRALGEGRNGGLCDVTRYFSVGRMTSADITSWICSETDGLFQVYSTTEEAQNFKLLSHSLRHLQNTTLFAAGISDAIITKRFGRESEAQSQVYNHLALGRALALIDLPPAARHLPAKARVVAKMISAGLARGPIVNEFKRIQRNEGDERAFQFLSAEADGFHTTPYGHCINGFTQEPCPKHLACFQGCTHFVNTGLDQNQERLASLLGKTELALTEITKRSGGVGHANQLRSAGQLIANLKATLASAPGERPFACGKDLSIPLKSRISVDA